MISRTHGQKASPTTFGKEIKVYEYRLKNQLNKLNKIQIKGSICSSEFFYLQLLIIAPPRHSSPS